ncbi:MAG: tetratricopeptide repeat protein, partial [Proteobacteria bacterium]|nr:tetratricopeptide repeat protein [Pseudomonadota bacterium]
MTNILEILGSFVKWLIDSGGYWGVIVAMAIVLGFVFVWRRMVLIVESVRSRSAIEDYLLGVEQALSLDLTKARERLERVIQQDPENHYARLLLGKVLIELGEPARAHALHLLLQRSFQVESAENDLQFA